MKQFFKKLWERLKNPAPVVLCIVWACALAAIAGALIVAFIGYTGALSYVVYVLAAILLGYTVYTVVMLAPSIKARVQASLRKRKFTRDFTENYSFRTLVFAACSFVINIGFVVFNTVFSVLTENAWYASLAGYYFLLSLLRGGVFWGRKRARARANGDEKKLLSLELNNYALCGGALFILDLAMAVAVTFMVLEQKPTQYTEITAIVFATFAVYKISLAIWNIFKARKTNDLQIQTFRNIGLVDAAVSLLSLQTTLGSTFSQGENMLALNAVTGAFVCLITMGLGVFMIIQATRRKKDAK